MSTKPSILELAKENQSSLQDSYRKVSDGHEGMATFKKHLDDKMEFTINVYVGFVAQEGEIEPDVKHLTNNLLVLLETGSYQNAWELLGDDEAALKKHFWPKNELRRIFDESFELGKSFKYLALNCGGMGIPQWGDGTLVFDEEQFASEELVALRQDSLLETGKEAVYFQKNETVDIPKLKTDLAQKEDICLLACLKHQDDLKDFSEEQLEAIILKPVSKDRRDYTEIITWKELKLEETVAKIRIQKEIYRAGARFLRQKGASILSRKEKRPFELVSNLQRQINEYSKKGINLELHP